MLPGHTLPPEFATPSRHDRSSILADESFPEHSKHIEGEDAPCSACHDPHGIDAIQGNPLNNTHLINFDIAIVGANSDNLGPEFEDQGLRQGRCFLACHGEQHRPCSYTGNSTDCN